MTTTLYPASGTVTSSCVCRFCEACDFTFEDFDYDYKCHECGGEATDFDNCDGVCWDFATEDMGEHFRAWCVANKTDEFAIYGRRMGWLSQSGHTGRLTTFRELLDNMTLSGDFTIRWKLSEDNKEFTMTRSSHDEPTGASFEVVVWKEGDDE